MYTLNGNHPVLGDLSNDFLAGEYDLAIQVAKAWHGRGYKPFLYAYVNGTPVVLYDWRESRKQLRLAA